MSGGSGPESEQGAAASPPAPRSVAPGRAQKAANRGREEILKQDRVLAQTAAGTLLEEGLSGPLFVVDAYEGSAAVWDWLLRGGWHSVLWPLVGETLVQRLQQMPALRAVLVLDGLTYEEIAERTPAAIDGLREALASGRLEAANGAYSRPLGLAVSGESHVRQFYYGLRAVRESLGIAVGSYLAGDGDLFPQLPQVLAGFGFKRLILQSHLAPLDSDPSGGSSLVRWQGPDGTQITTAARYRFLSHDSMGRPEDKGRSNSVGEEPLGNWRNERLELLRGEAGRRGIGHPLIVRSTALRPEEAPFPGMAAVAARQDLRFVTPREYFDLAQGEAPSLRYGLDGMGTAIPWGLDGEHLQRQTVETENALLLAERLDALAYAMGRQSEEKEIDGAWKLLLRSQHRDFRTYGPCIPKQQRKRVSEVAGETARASRETGRRVAEAAATYLASHVNSAGVEGQGLVIFNPSSWPRREYMEVTVKGEGCRMSHGGEEIASQVVSRKKGAVTVGFVAGVPALGYSLLEALPLARGPETGERRKRVSTGAARRSFANDSYSAELDQRGSLRLEVEGRTTVEAGGYLTVWKNGRWHDSRKGVRRLELDQQGPVFERYRLSGRLAGIPFFQWVTFYAGLPRIDLLLAFDFGMGTTFGPKESAAGEEEKKLCLNLVSPLRRAFADSPFLVSEVTGERIAALRMVGLDDEWQRGVALLNRGSPGYRFDHDRGVLQKVLAWSPKSWPQVDGAPLPGPVSGVSLKGSYVCECAVVPFASRIEALRAAMSYQLPCLGVLVPPRAGRLPEEGSFLNVEPEQALLSALFVQANQVYARLWNGSPNGVEANLGSGGPLSLHACSLDLREGETVERIGLAPWGLGTLRLGGTQG